MLKKIQYEEPSSPEKIKFVLTATRKKKLVARLSKLRTSIKEYGNRKNENMNEAVDRRVESLSRLISVMRRKSSIIERGHEVYMFLKPVPLTEMEMLREDLKNPREYEFFKLVYCANIHSRYYEGEELSAKDRNRLDKNIFTAITRQFEIKKTTPKEEKMRLDLFASQKEEYAKAHNGADIKELFNQMTK